MGSLKEAFIVEGVKLNVGLARPLTQRQNTKAVSILQHTWKPIHELLEYVLKSTEDETQVQQSLHAIHNLISMSGSSNLKFPMEEITKALCEWEFKGAFEGEAWETVHKDVHVARTVVGVGRTLSKVLSGRAWAHVFSALQRVSGCANRLEGDSSEVELLHFNALSKKIAENIARHLPTSAPRAKTPHHYAPSVGKEGCPFPQKVNEEVKAAGTLSPDRISCLSDDDDKDIHIQQVNRSGINSAIVLKQRTKKYMSEVVQNSSDATIKKANTAASEREAYSLKSDRSTFNRSISKENLKEEISNLRSNLESLFAYTTSFSVNLRTTT